ncbi:hypothetical protein [Anaerofustis stercorihominis]|uniref:Uncharacterized protein n=1 Tax=Anaerofustis stercorihominis TaxID=214853 RepID=A0A3E3DX46_9FIRM|nr:hypothetical protein [Anaerofustis stercorihominis]RGD73830.1 hypothetical protein DW687_08625 [Anaerofustis stercorihominis]
MVTITGTKKEVEQILSGVCSHTDINGNCVCDENCIQCKEGCIQAYGVELKITKPKRWKPKEGDDYYTFYEEYKARPYIDRLIWNYNIVDERNYEYGHVYKTEEEAQNSFIVFKTINENKMTIDEIDGWIADDGRKHIYCIKHGIGSNTIQIDYARSILEANTDYFKDKEIAQKVINECGKEALKKYYFKVVD